MLDTCKHCEGFLPHKHLTACPHCHARLTQATSPQRRLFGSFLTAAFSVAGGGLVATTLMACYGAPPPRPSDPAPNDPKGASSACEPSPNDQDGDCYTAQNDCDDLDSSRHDTCANSEAAQASNTP